MVAAEEEAVDLVGTERGRAAAKADFALAMTGHDRPKGDRSVPGLWQGVWALRGTGLARRVPLLQRKHKMHNTAWHVVAQNGGKSDK